MQMGSQNALPPVHNILDVHSEHPLKAYRMPRLFIPHSGCEATRCARVLLPDAAAISMFMQGVSGSLESYDERPGLCIGMSTTP